MLKGDVLRPAVVIHHTDSCRHLHPPRHRLTVPELSIAGRALERVPRCVSVIQDGPLPGLVGIARHDVRFDPDGATNRFVDDIPVAFQQTRDVRRKPIHEGAVGDHAGLDDFGERGPIFLARQAFEVLNVAEGRCRLVHGAH